MNYHLAGPDSLTQTLEARVHVLRSRLIELRAWVAGQVGAFPASPHSDGSDTMAARVMAEIDARFRGLL
jgi:hypothetical protein